MTEKNDVSSAEIETAISQGEQAIDEMGMVAQVNPWSVFLLFPLWICLYLIISCLKLILKTRKWMEKGKEELK